MDEEREEVTCDHKNRIIPRSSNCLSPRHWSRNSSDVEKGFVLEWCPDCGAIRDVQIICGQPFCGDPWQIPKMQDKRVADPK